MTEEEKVELQNMVTAAAQVTEERLIAIFGPIIEGINKKVEVSVKASSELETKAKTAFDTLPAVIHTQVENQLGVLTKQFEERQKETGGNSGGGGDYLDKLLANSDKLIGMWNAYKQPTTEAAMTAKMNEVFNWHRLLSKLEKGGGSGEDVTKAIADTFAGPKQE